MNKIKITHKTQKPLMPNSKTRCRTFSIQGTFWIQNLGISIFFPGKPGCWFQRVQVRQPKFYFNIIHRIIQVYIMALNLTSNRPKKFQSLKNGIIVIKINRLTRRILKYFWYEEWKIIFFDFELALLLSSNKEQKIKIYIYQ